jgi:hypothetical protein
MDPYKYEWMTHSKTVPSNTCVIDANINELANLLNIIRDYENPYKYIEFADSETRLNRTVEITPELFITTDENIQRELCMAPMKSNLQQAIFSRYSELDHTKKYKLVHDISIAMKVKLIYAERLEYERKYYLTVFPHKYASKFKECGFQNFYDSVKQEITSEIDELISQKIKLLR